MNYMEKIAELLGVEIGERFKLFNTITKEEEVGVFWIGEDGMYKENPNGSKGLIVSCWADVLPGFCEIVELPWKPKEGECCYYITPNGSLLSTTIDFSFSGDMLLVHNGMVYRTPEEALEHKDETMRKWAEIRKELEE